MIHIDILKVKAEKDVRAIVAANQDHKQAVSILIEKGWQPPSITTNADTNGLLINTAHSAKELKQFIDNEVMQSLNGDVIDELKDKLHEVFEDINILLSIADSYYDERLLLKDNKVPYYNE